ncbi:hypothetical protein [Providencia sp. Me31A]|uniref:hypothetical protein n=1 Tax=Providencia sp. Me31A TaxID=3392637 RepID=UPI003D279C47
MKTILKCSWLIAAVVSLSACDDIENYGGKGKFYYSNPSTHTITFKLDDKNYDIFPDSKGVIFLSSGLHHLENAQGDVTDFFIFENNSGGIINPNQFVYYTLSEVYAVDGKETHFKPANYPIVINGHTLDLPIRSSNSIVIDGNLFGCNYPIGEEFPESITLNDHKLEGNIKSKCFDKLELIKYMKDVYGENLLPQNNYNDSLYSDSINMNFFYDIPRANFDNPSVQQKAELLVQLVTQLKNSNDANIHKKLNKSFHQAVIEFVDTYAENATSNTASENIEYNNFIQRINFLRENGVWIRE